MALRVAQSRNRQTNSLPSRILQSVGKDGPTLHAEVQEKRTTGNMHVLAFSYLQALIDGADDKVLYLESIQSFNVRKEDTGEGDFEPEDEYSDDDA